MKTILTTALAALALAGSAAAITPPAGDFNQSQNQAESLCPSIGELAGLIMETRQIGARMSELMAIMPSGDENAELRAVTRSMILAAYDSPRYYGDRARVEAVQEFRSEWELVCYQTEGAA